MVTVPVGAKKLTQHAIKHSFWAILPALGECFHAIAIDSRHWANFVAPMLLTAPRDVTVGTNAGASGRLYETHDAFARQNSAENRCIWLAMVLSVSPEAKHTPAKVMTVSRELPAAVPVGSGGLAGLRANAPSNTSATRRHWCGGRRRDRRARAGFEIDHSEPQARVWRSRGRPGPTAPRTPAAPQATSSTANSG